jgi:peptidoglycan/xylan/chitin deacetylase (PgdA/CDA1 family)
MRAILTYHSIDPSGSPISVSPEEFRSHVLWLASGRVKVVPLADLLALPGEQDAVALTFDDAFENFGGIAAGLLRDHSLPATLFVVAGHVGGNNAWGGRSDGRVPTLPLLDWDRLGRLTEGGVTLGAHTRRHPHLTRLSAAERSDELLGAAAEIRERTGHAPEQFAYPYGDLNPEVVEAVRPVYRLAVTTELRMLRAAEDAVQLPRLDMFYLRAPGRLEAWGSARFSSTLWLRAQARRARSTLSAVIGGW